MSQFKNQTSLVASQGLSLLSPLALKKRQPASSSSHIYNSECGNDLREREQSRLWSHLMTGKISGPAY